MLGLGLVRRLWRASARQGDVVPKGREGIIVMPVEATTVADVMTHAPSGPPATMVPEEVVTYEGHVHLHPPDDYGDGFVTLVGKSDLANYLYEQLDVPSENGSPMETSFYGRITVEVFPDPDPDLNWWP